VSGNAGKLLAEWIKNTAATGAFPTDEARAQALARQAIAELRIEGVDAAALEAAAGGDLAAYLLNKLRPGAPVSESNR
jgi:hypothetical protein